MASNRSLSITRRWPPDPIYTLLDKTSRDLLSETSRIGSLMNKPGQLRCLELGCGPGEFLLAATEHCDLVIGIDICLAWLVIAKKRLDEQGRTGLLLCACPEALPLANEQFDFVGLFDVIEHVTDRSRTLQELVRVMCTGGQLVCTTPHRFSFSAEPHVGVWKVGFLPRVWIPEYVRWRTGQEYRYTYLLLFFTLDSFGEPYCTSSRSSELWSERTIALALRNAAEIVAGGERSRIHG